MRNFSYILATPLLSFAFLAACSDDPQAESPSTGGQTSVETGGSGGSSGGTTAVGGGMSSGGIGPSGGGTSGSGGAPTGGTGGTESGGAGGTGGQVEEIETLEDGSPIYLSDTGLYEDDMETLAPGVRPFEPRFALWTDDAAKQRWIWIPDGEVIDTSNMDYWEFPTGTKLFKEFVRGTTRVETRVMTKTARGGWERAAYQWRDDQMEADALVDPVENASGTDHDIPSQEDCGTCHFKVPDKILGFSAIQLAWDNPDEDAWTLQRLQDAGMLSDAPPTIELPGDETAQAALGYMHANCGHCHNPQSSVTTRVTVNFWLTTSTLDDVTNTPTYTSAVCQPISLEEGGVPGITTIIDPGSPDTSSVFRRADLRDGQYNMPPLGTEDIDTAGVAATSAWIESLSGVTCE